MPKQDKPTQKYRGREDRLPVKLFDHVRDTEKRKEMQGQYEATKYILDETLRRVLTKKLAASIEEAENPDKYALADWQAKDENELGYRRAIREILKLLP